MSTSIFIHVILRKIPKNYNMWQTMVTCKIIIAGRMSDYKSEAGSRRLAAASKRNLPGEIKSRPPCRLKAINRFAGILWPSKWSMRPALNGCNNCQRARHKCTTRRQLHTRRLYISERALHALLKRRQKIKWLQVKKIKNDVRLWVQRCLKLISFQWLIDSAREYKRCAQA